METEEGENKKRASKAAAVVKEIVESEATYVEGLKVALREFYEPLVRGPGAIWSAGVASRVFMNLEPICHANTTLSERLAQAASSVVDDEDVVARTDQVVAVFEELHPLLFIYADYCSRYPAAVAELEAQSRQADVRQLLRRIEAQPAVRRRSLADFLIMPIQRICKYPLLLRKLAESDVAHGQPGIQSRLMAMARTVEGIAGKINVSRATAANIQKLLSLSTKLDGSPKGFKLAVPSRNFLQSGPVLDKLDPSSTSEPASWTAVRHAKLFLFTDLVLVLERNSPSASLPGSSAVSSSSGDHSSPLLSGGSSLASLDSPSRRRGSMRLRGSASTASSDLLTGSSSELAGPSSHAHSSAAPLAGAASDKKYRFVDMFSLASTLVQPVPPAMCGGVQHVFKLQDVISKVSHVFVAPSSNACNEWVRAIEAAHAHVVDLADRKSAVLASASRTSQAASSAPLRALSSEDYQHTELSLLRAALERETVARAELQQLVVALLSDVAELKVKVAVLSAQQQDQSLSHSSTTLSSSSSTQTTTASAPMVASLSKDSCNSSPSTPNPPRRSDLRASEGEEGANSSPKLPVSPSAALPRASSSASLEKRKSLVRAPASKDVLTVYAEPSPPPPASNPPPAAASPSSSTPAEILQFYGSYGHQALKTSSGASVPAKQPSTAASTSDLPATRSSSDSVIGEEESTVELRGYLRKGKLNSEIRSRSRRGSNRARSQSKDSKDPKSSSRSNVASSPSSALSVHMNSNEGPSSQTGGSSGPDLDSMLEFFGGEEEEEVSWVI